MKLNMKLQCRLCGERFRWNAADFPDECPICKQYIGRDGRPEIAAPHIALRIGKSADNVYKAMENGADHRANVASEFLGVPKSELSDMKITNLRDANVGESSAPSIEKNLNSLAAFSQQQAAQQVNVNPNVVYNPNSKAVAQEARMMTPEKAHPRSGVGTGLSTLTELRGSRFAR